MTIAILRKDKGQKIARPFNRASTTDEAMNCIVWCISYRTGPALGAWSRASKATDAADTNPAGAAKEYGIDFSKMDTDEPICTHGTTKFYAFTEE